MTFIILHQYVETGGKPSTRLPPEGLVEQSALKRKFLAGKTRMNNVQKGGEGRRALRRKMERKRMKRRKSSK